MREMSGREWRSFVLEGTRTGKLATNRADGRPHVTPVWFLIDDSETDGGGTPQLLFTTWHESLKCKSLRRDPRFSLCVDDQQPPFAYVMFECTARLTDEPGELARWAARIGARYMGEARGREYGERNAVPGEYLVRARVDRVIARHGIAE
ncbi:PPOX class F420-dependent oxidoreductase [Streptomyces sp. NPDC059828]|uniref:PPOX class F420-dependent oxidoreductase n=1 Tax=Streptomyces sp. NPDC059828 TaxID=3346965 RepID=UPI00364F472A